jgi:hypothetical protein
MPVAPAASTWRDAIRVGQLVHDRGVSAYESFAPQAFAGWVASDIPVLVDHERLETRRHGQRHRTAQRLVDRDVRA